MKAFFIRSPIVADYLLTLLFSWDYWVYLLVQGVRAKPDSSVIHFPGLIGDSQ